MLIGNGSIFEKPCHPFAQFDDVDPLSVGRIAIECASGLECGRSRSGRSAINRAQQRRLAAARRADQGRDLAARNRERNVEERLLRPVPQAKILGPAGQGLARLPMDGWPRRPSRRAQSRPNGQFPRALVPRQDLSGIVRRRVLARPAPKLRVPDPMVLTVSLMKLRHGKYFAHAWLAPKRLRSRFRRRTAVMFNAGNDDDQQQRGRKYHRPRRFAVLTMESQVIKMETQVHETALGVDERKNAIDRQLGGPISWLRPASTEPLRRLPGQSPVSCRSSRRARRAGNTMRQMVCHLLAPQA